ncbi:hypothetical protein KCP77_04830 [Salmonella enterica subsp. enterica]|nr:hypothetical protein KCP77_04830 [Salmonella enterica subsp. enterica]
MANAAFSIIFPLTGAAGRSPRRSRGRRASVKPHAVALPIGGQIPPDKGEILSAGENVLVMSRARGSTPSANV